MTARTTSLLTSIVAASFLTIIIPSVVLAQNARVVTACASDLTRWCGATQERRACVKLHFREFSLPCQLEAVKYGAIKKACGLDVKKNCAGISPGAGRVEACIKDHFADLSEECKATISQAVGKS
jgi:hypothetical protein